MTLNILKIFVFNNLDAYIEKNNEDKYLNFALRDKNMKFKIKLSY